MSWVDTMITLDAPPLWFWLTVVPYCLGAGYGLYRLEHWIQRRRERKGIEERRERKSA